MQTRDELIAELAVLNGRLSEGLERISKGDRSAQYNLDTVRRRRDEVQTKLNACAPTPMVRRVYLRSCW